MLEMLKDLLAGITAFVMLIAIPDDFIPDDIWV